MNRLFILAASAAIVGGGLLITATSASAEVNNDVVLYGRIDGLHSDGAFPAMVTLKDPVSGKVVANSKTLVDIKDGKYKADVKAPGLKNDATYEISMEGLEAAEDFTLIDYVQLQGSTPGSQQTGHLNISGYVLASRIGLGISPTIAKVQINETGTAQGVRSITNTGTAVYGQATAGTGLAAGGYFSTSSVGGRAMVGDAFSTTGSTVGGLFYNRSSDGVAVWGRHIKTTGNSIGVFGQTASSAGTAVMAENTSTGDTAQLAGSNGSLFTHGVFPKHEYTNGNARTMVPVAYGYIATDGFIYSGGSGNFTVTNVSAGKCTVDVNNVSGTFIVVASSYQSIGNEFASISTGDGGDFTINSWNLTSNALANSDVYFIAYLSTAGSAFRGQMPTEMQKKYHGDPEAWRKADPKGFESYRLAQLAQEDQATRVNPVTIPYDEGEPAGQPTRNNVLPPRQ